MNKCQWLICLSLAAAPAAANAVNQDIYLAASIGAHEFADEAGGKFGIHLGGKNIFERGFMLGGELEFSKITNDDFEKRYSGDKEDYSLAANVPIGKRFELGGENAIDAYGLIGYSSLRVYSDTASERLDGVRWGAGVDGNFSNFLVGLRYTQGKLDSDLVGDYTEKNLSLQLGYRFQL
ncbi:outer membrane beta-barrel protein [Enterovibrio norvegicus]|uniref:Opacity protein n=2 Tax=Enterovibrio norvegicus TaxID=188144 RepID=A0A1I5KN37_9GAMM|nr:outer membrane beta-barrel protein [Enterovibrio norvegicus]OEF56467.1 hypothetical protein A1OU_17055 [Enterovibrio norvegicus]SFO86352.1 Opacity protein [Enterovibrio norvegicus DSM 15893]